MYDKKKQLTRHKTANPKKMPQTEYRLYVDFVNEKSSGVCQCGCGRPAQDIHHAYFGAGGRDDRYIVAICRECHYAIHHGTNIDEASALKLLCKSIGKDNWKEYTNEYA